MNLNICSLCKFFSTNFTTRCGHQFHKKCIDSWLDKNKNCPQCPVFITNTEQLELMHINRINMTIDDYIRTDPTLLVLFLTNFFEYIDSPEQTPYFPLLYQIFERLAGVLVEYSKDSSLLYNVCSSGHVYIAKLLIENGADVNWRNGNNFIPLYAASHQSRLNFFKVIFDADKFILRLEAAIKQDQMNMGRVLLEHGGKSTPHQRYFEIMATSDIKKCYLPIEAAILNGHVDVVKLLIEHGAECNFTNDSGTSSMHFAVFQNNLDIIQLLIDNGVSVNAVDKNGVSPLHYAALSGSFYVVKFLVERGANLNLVDAKGYTPIHDAVFGGKVEIIDFIINDESINLNLVKSFGYPPVCYAVIKNRIDVVNFLIQKGANINAVAENGNTPLSLAGSSFYFPLHKILLANGANENAGFAERQKYLQLKLQEEKVVEDKQRIYQAIVSIILMIILICCFYFLYQKSKKK